jgi:hypothetical protein
VRFEPSQPGLRLLSLSAEMPVERFGYFGYGGWYYREGLAGIYSSVCVGPCVARFAPGPYRVAIARPGGRAVPAPELLVVRGPTLVRGYYADRSGLRAAGWVIGITGLVGGIVMIAVSADGPEVCDVYGYCQRQVNGALLAGGIGVILATSITGSVLAMQRDEAHITVEPLTTPAAGRRESPFATVSALGRPQGAALTVRF